MKTILDFDHVNAFCRHTHVELPSHHPGPLAGLRFGAKDIFDITGYPTGFGSPDWFNSHPRATQTAPAIEMLVQSGASLVGKTHTDELTYSLLGMNAHYGTPINSAAPLRIPGGSSSGSAAAVAANLVDFAIGSDTGGSVRAPASFCGIYGMRPTHGRISLAHTRPLAKSFDTVGWFTREPKLLLQVGEVLLREKAVRQAEQLLIESKREAASLSGAAKREAERIISDATGEISEFRSWLTSAISESERLYRVQTQSLNAAEQAIGETRGRLKQAFERLAALQGDIDANIDENDRPVEKTFIRKGARSVEAAKKPVKKAAPKPAKKAAKKSTTKKRK